MNKHYIKVKNFLHAKFNSRRNFKTVLTNYYYDDLVKALIYLIPQKTSLLEIGCSDGSLFTTLDVKEGVGAYVTIDHLRKPSANTTFIECLPEKIPRGNKKFDYILYFNSIGFIEDVQKSLEGVHTFCHNDTRVIITYYNYLWEGVFSFLEALGIKYKQEIKQSWLSLGDIENLLQLADFEVIAKGGRMLFPLYIPLLSRFLNKYCAQLPYINKLCMTQYIIAKPRMKEKQSYTVSVIVPTRNEAGTVEELVLRTPLMGSHTEILFIEGGSTDNTQGEIKRVMKKYKDRDIVLLPQEGKGKGDAVRKGFDNAKGDILMILDADLSTPPEDLPKFYDALTTGKGDLIIGTRLVYPIEKQAMPLLNIFGNKIFSVIFTWLLNQQIKDTLCGTKVLFKKDYEKIKRNRKYFGDFDPFGDFDLLFGASKLNLKITEIPVRYKERVYGKTNIQRFRHGWLLIKMCMFASKKMKFI